MDADVGRGADHLTAQARTRHPRAHHGDLRAALEHVQQRQPRPAQRRAQRVRRLDRQENEPHDHICWARGGQGRGMGEAGVFEGSVGPRMGMQRIWAELAFKYRIILVVARDFMCSGAGTDLMRRWPTRRPPAWARPSAGDTTGASGMLVVPRCNPVYCGHDTSASYEPKALESHSDSHRLAPEGYL